MAVIVAAKKKFSGLIGTAATEILLLVFNYFERLITVDASGDLK